jgi:hypothetical protein
MNDRRQKRRAHLENVMVASNLKIEQAAGEPKGSPRSRLGDDHK